MYAPRGVFFDDNVLVASDSGNHRVLIWYGLPRLDGQAADVVLGQPDFVSEGPNAGGRTVANGLHLPTGVGIFENHLFVADAWHHRILVWNALPLESSTPPDYAIGQADLESAEPNRGAAVSVSGFFWPYGIGFVAGWFYVADTGNRRVLGWRGLPERDRPADLVIGQDAPDQGLENRGAAPCARSFRWPHAVTGTADVLYVADAGNHRVLGWSPGPDRDRDADLVLGQADFLSSSEFPYIVQGPARLRFPYGAACDGQTLAVADTANNRVLCWHSLPTQGCARPADLVIGQTGFDAHGENRWTAVTPETLCWPYGIWLHNGLLAVADSGNNRVMMWAVEGACQERYVPEETTCV